ncbi:DUF4113 domain-containing protein [Polaromonas sp.]|uniref:DUF4113 domain-containing protein n=1 Tax=Polaromonas sp. TaxID=1869339 RepID=UPI00351EC26F
MMRRTWSEVIRWVVLARVGAKGPHREFAMKQNLLTPLYTASWADLPVAKA